MRQLIAALAATALVYKAGAQDAAPLPLPRAAPGEVGLDAGALSPIQQNIQGLVSQGRISGAAFAVMRDGKVVAEGVAGYLDKDKRTPFTADTICRIMSMSKPVSTAGFLTLVDEGLVELDDPVYKYIPEFKDMKVFAGQGRTVPLDRPITIRHLLTHTSGITYGFMDRTPVDVMYTNADMIDPTETLEKKVLRITQLPLTAQPGTKWQYGFSTDVLGRIAEIVSGKPIDQFYQDKLFGPLGMVDTGFWVPPEKHARLATVYTRGSRGLELYTLDRTVYTSKPAYLSAGGGIVSTLNDFSRFAQMILNGGEFNGVRILKAATVTEMLTNHITPELLPISYSNTIVMRGTGFGYGIGLVLPEPGNPWVRGGEASWGGGMSSNFWMWPQDGLVAVAMMQLAPFTDDMRTAVRDPSFKALLQGGRFGPNANKDLLLDNPEVNPEANSEVKPEGDAEAKAEVLPSGRLRGVQP